MTFLPLYILVSAVLFALQQRGKKPLRRGPGVKGFLGYLFPADIYFHPSSRVDLKMLVLNGTIAASAAYFGFTSGFQVTRWLSHLHHDSQSLTMAWLGRPTPLSEAFRLKGLAANLGFALALAMGRDLGRIVVHYPMHKIPALWQIHKYHHNAEVLTPFTAFRLHPIESALSSLTGGLCHGVALYLFISIFGVEKVSPVTFLGMGAVELWTGSMGMFEHSNKWLSLGRFGYVFANPSNHLVHHSCEERHWDKNFANHFAIFDLLLGTLYIPKREEHFRIGVHLPNGQPLVSRSLFRDFYYRPMADFLRVISKRPPVDVKDDAHPPSSVELNCWCGPNCPVLANPTSPEAQPSPAWTKLSDLLPQRRSERSVPQEGPIASTSDRPTL